ncbi:MAG: hypothetical protein Q8K75_03030 [Chlamydiales bacterium]|nr:hypothetical protein [Chlamydiales bacterium]
MNYFKSLIILFAFGGMILGLGNHAVVHFLAAYNVDAAVAYSKSESIYLLPATLIGLIAALTLPRFISFRWLGVGLSLTCLVLLGLFAVIYYTPMFAAAVPYAAIGFGIMAKTFPLLLMVFLWGLANHMYSFSEACWHYPFLALVVGVGAAVGTLMTMAGAVQGVSALIMLAVLLAGYGALIAWLTNSMEPAYDRPIVAKKINHKATWVDYIIPATLLIGGAVLISKINYFVTTSEAREIYKDSTEALTTFLQNHVILLGLGGLVGFIALVGMAFYLRHDKDRAWKVSGWVLVGLGILIQVLPFAIPGDLRVSQLASIYDMSLLVVLMSLLARIALTALPNDARFIALVWLEVLLIPIMRWSDAFTDSLGAGLIPAVVVLWVAVIVGMWLLSKLVEAHHSRRS